MQEESHQQANKPDPAALQREYHKRLAFRIENESVCDQVSKLLVEHKVRVERLPTLLEIGLLSNRKVMRKLNRCPESDYFCQERHRMAKLKPQEARALLSKLVMRVLASRQHPPIDEASAS